LRDLRRIKGTLAELMDEDVIELGGKDDYVYVTLTDEEEIPGALEIIRGAYPNMIFMGYENSRSFAEDLSQFSGADYISPEDLFVEFYRNQNGKELSESQLAIVKDILKT
jgi:exonuclease SbcD